MIDGGKGLELPTWIPSTLSGVVSVDRRKKVQKCGACSRSKKYFDGCSLVECPQRKPVTASMRDDQQWQSQREQS